MSTLRTDSEQIAFVKSYWPGGKRFAISMAVDDVHPESSSDEEGLDYGGEMDDGNFGYVSEIVSKIERLKVTLFIPPDWMVRPDSFTGSVLSLLNLVRGRRSYPPGSFRLDFEKQREWSSWLRAKVQAGNFEIGIHGLSHFNPAAPRAGLEFFGMPREEAIRRIREAESIFRGAGLPYVRGFRPPGWCWNKDLLEAINSLGYLFFAGSSDPEGQVGPDAQAHGAGYPGVSSVYPDRIPGTSLVSLTANTWEGQTDRARSIARLGGLVLIQTHVGPSAYGVRHLSSKSADRFVEMVRALESEFGDVAWFASLREIAERTLAVDNVRIRTESMGGERVRLEVTNANDGPVEGLTLTTKGKIARILTERADASLGDSTVCLPRIDGKQSMTLTLLVNGSWRSQ